MAITKDSLRQLIGRGKLDKALDQLEELAKSNGQDSVNSVIMLRGRLNRLKDDESKGLLSFEDVLRMRNQITYAILYILEELDDSQLVEDHVDNQDESDSQKTISILFVASNPRDSKALRIGEEFQKIRKSLNWSDKRELFILEQEWAAGIRELRRAMLKIKPNIVHFSGHGSPEGGILLEDEEGYGTALDISGLGKLFSGFKKSTQCVLLNSCYSEPQAKEIAKHVPVVIGTKRDIPDETSIAFSEAFYEAIGSDMTFEEAFQFACNNVNLTGLDGEDIPVIMTQSS